MSPTSYLDCYSNLIWLHRGGAPCRILCVAQDPTRLAEALGRWSSDVLAVTEAECDARMDELRARGPFDVILLASDRAPQLMAGLAGALGSSGRVYAVVQRVNRAATRAASEEAGLGVRQRYGVAPSVDQPFYVVPDDAGTTRAYLSIRAPRRRVRATLQRIALHLGWRPGDSEGTLFVLEST